MQGRDAVIDVVNDAIDFMQEHSIQAGGFKWAHTPAVPVDFDKLRDNAMSAVAGIAKPTAVDAARAIDKALAGLGDGHSLVTCAGYTRGHENEYERPPLKQPMPEATWHEGNILQVTVPFFISADAGERKQYQDILKNALNNAADRGVRGVIVDLRENGGGAMCPMINGLSPLLGPGTLGQFADRHGAAPFNINYGAPPEHKIDLAKVDNFKLTGTPVAVLAGENTCSSGEITFLSLRGRANTQSFGAATHGSSSGNISVPFDHKGESTGITVHLCTGICTDRNGQGDGGPIKPDVETPDPLKAALQWVATAAAAPKIMTAPQRRPGL